MYKSQIFCVLKRYLDYLWLEDRKAVKHSNILAIKHSNILPLKHSIMLSLKHSILMQVCLNGYSLSSIIS